MKKSDCEMDQNQWYFKLGDNNKDAFIFISESGFKTCKNHYGATYCYNVGHTAFCDSEPYPVKKRSLRIRNKH